MGDLGGVSSTPRPFDAIAGASDYLIARFAESDVTG
jgi:hypothetical protein